MAESEKLGRDGILLFTTRIARLFAYGFLSVILVLYLVSLGFSEVKIGMLLTLTLVGDTLVSLWITVNADRIGRKKMLLIGAALMLFAGVSFVLTSDFILLVVAATLGVISPSGNEVGPFLALEQASLSQIVTAKRRTKIFAWYNLVGSFATAMGALCSGWLAQILQHSGFSTLQSYRWVVIVYAAFGLILFLFFTMLSPRIEVPKSHITMAKRFGLHKSRGVVFKLSALFSLDAFAGGFVIQSIIAYWFHIKFGADPGMLGSIFFGANVLAGISALSAVKIAEKIGLIRTMVFTHIPSNILLIFVPLMPNFPLAITLLLLRFSISQMDVPTRQSYTMSVVEPDERSAAAGITGIARTTGASISPAITGPLLSHAGLISMPFYIAGGLKIVYDLLLYRAFQKSNPGKE
jgi:MFS family permease